MYFKRWMAENYPDGLCFVRKTNIMEVEKSLVVRKRGHVGKGSPDQPRDERGRWTSEGSDSGSSGDESTNKQRLKEMIKNGDVSLVLNKTIQNRHYKGTKEYNDFVRNGVEKSYFTISQRELQKILIEKSTTGSIRIDRSGVAREIFDCEKLVAYDTRLKVKNIIC